MIYWLFATPGLSRRDALFLYDNNDLEDLWRKPPNNFLLKRRDEKLLSAEITELNKRGIWVVSYGGLGYPESLMNIDDPPMLLYGMGKMPDDALPKIAVIGSRKCTSYGLRTTKKLARGLVNAGFVIVSGMAFGIDTQSHITAIDTVIEEYGEDAAPPVTIAVLGCGVDICYPSLNLDIYGRIQRYGCVVSEYPPGTHPMPFMFPQRNRIITGLSMGIIVVEAAVKSGTSRTVDIALSQGREVFVVPGCIDSMYSAGTNNLIKEGAKLVTSYKDVVYELRQELGNETPNGEHNIMKNMYENMLNEEIAIMKQLSGEPVDTGYLAAATEMAMQDLMYYLSRLEISGMVKTVGNGIIKL